jgi:aldose 1-epimerase
MATDAALRPLAPGPLLRIGCGALAVDIAPQAGGRLAQVSFDGVDWLVGHGTHNAATIGWGSFPMLPWAGRVRHGRFDFRGRHCELPVDLGAHAIHGVGLALPWQVEQHTPTRAVLALRLPEDARWPFGGSARQCIEAGERRLRLTLSLSAGTQAMPATLGWHPWFPKPDALDFRPERYYPRDAEGIAQLPLRGPPPGPWDDCFVNREPVLLRRVGQCLQLSSDCDHWVVYDEPAHATCVEPQSGPPDAFNLGLAPSLEPGESLSAWFLMEW